ncbi:hypothetical protein [uncultured Microbacterium sp.]|uniref:hypothetical protein n=1 Tax=Microbacterium algeriense TaxID=2615184 RepID=UPI0025955686|nr:hypothetical protein [uncultured Microbacterium sp.]
MRSSVPFAALAASATILALAGCAGASSGGELTPEDSPLSEYLSAAWGGDLSPEEQHKKFAEQQAKSEALMAECMAEEGFEYAPAQDVSLDISTGDEWEPDKREWVEKYGYGYVSSPGAEAPVEEPAEETVDPNAAYVSSLSASEQTAYYETLYGVSPTDEELEDGTYEYRWEDAGCQGWAQHEVSGDDPAQSEEFTALWEKLQKLSTEAQEGPELADLNAEWATCMADHGEPGFAAQADAGQSIIAAQEKIYEAASGGDGESGDGESGDGESGDGPAADIQDPNDSPEMKALGEREIELALVDLECREKTSFATRSLRIQFALEEKFIAENKAELDAFKAAAEQSK